MIKARAWPVKAMYLLIAAALAISLIIIAAPLQKASADCTADVCAEWDRVDTPTTDGWVLSPRSYIVDANVAAEGEVAYAIVEKWYDGHDFVLLKSDDYAATWDDITDALVDEAEEELFNEPEDLIEELVLVATDWEDPDFVAVALVWYDYNGGSDYYYLNVFFSTDGGDTFIDTGEVEDSIFFNVDLAGPDVVSDLVVTPESGGEREIAIGGVASDTESGLFRCTVTGDAPGAWYDTTDYDGWDDDGAFTSEWALDIGVSPNWGLDKTILVTTISPAASYYDVYLQCGSWGTSEGWNEDSTLGIEPVIILEDEDVPMWLPAWDARAIAGMTFPEDYNSKNANDRVLWVWANYYDSGDPMCDIMRVEDDSADPVGPMGQIEDGELFLTNISYQGTIAEGKAIAGVLGDGLDDFAECCEGIQVYRNDGIRNMDICCERWHDACKPPTGRAGMGVHWVGDDKAYGVTMGDMGPGDGPYDESAFSVTFDEGDTWNQLSLIDTDIEYISDVAVSPDCNKTFLATVNYRGNCSCDSVWVHAETLHEAEEYNGQWLRTWAGHLIGWNSQEGDHTDFPFVSRRSLLRLAQDETDGETVFLLDRMTGDVYKSGLESLACWDPIGSSELDEIVDFVAVDEDTLFALDYYGDVAMFDGDEWQEAVDSEVSRGWTIAVWGDWILVGGAEGDVGYSDDGGETFTDLEDVTEYDSAHVTVAFDSYFDQNDTVYAALANADDDNGIYILVIDGDTDDWTKLAAEAHDYTGLVLDRADGNPWTSPETGGVLYASYRGEECDYDCGYDTISECWYTGVARCLTPIIEICCGAGDAEWDYLTWDLSWDDGETNYDADFRMPPQALKICGCLTADTNSHLFAIDGYEYDMDEGLNGTVWMFEDCYAKKGVELNSPADGYVVGPDSCDCCNVPFSISWDRLCDACCYQIQFAMDEDFTDINDSWWVCPEEPMTPSDWIGCEFDPEFTYYWRIRAVEAETCQDITSWWSEPRSFTVAPTAAAGAINLVSPEPGDTGVAIDNLGFSWIMQADADSYDWVLDNNSDFSSPVEEIDGLLDTAYGCTKTLSYDATYYWQVTAYKDGSEISKSAVGTFRTMVEPAEPPPVEEPVTPFWVWVVIGIGAVLVIVVIVLIFRTRRV